MAMAKEISADTAAIVAASLTQAYVTGRYPREDGGKQQRIEGEDVLRYYKRYLSAVLEHGVPD